MTNGYPETTGGLGYRFDHHGCQYGQETRRLAEMPHVQPAGGCAFGQENRRNIDDMRESTRWTNRFLVGNMAVIIIGIIVYVATRI